MGSGPAAAHGPAGGKGAAAILIFYYSLLLFIFSPNTTNYGGVSVGNITVFLPGALKTLREYPSLGSSGPGENAMKLLCKSCEDTIKAIF